MHSTEKIAGSVSAERVGQGDSTHRVLYTWWVLGLAVIGEWLAPGGAIVDLSRQLECVKNHFSSCSNKLEQLFTCSYFVSVDN